MCEIRWSTMNIKLKLLIFTLSICIIAGMLFFLCLGAGNTDVRTLFREKRCIKDNEFIWRPTGFVYPPGVLGLHTEIEQFHEYMQPTSTEYALWMRVVDRVNSTVQQVWPDARVEIFGSFANGLALPNSDIDLILMGASGKKPLHTLASKIVDCSVPNSIEVKDNFRIPMIEYIDRESKIQVDLSFADDGPAQIEMVTLFNDFQRQYPALARLVLVLKQYLKQHDLNNNCRGGISSHAVLLLCISFFQMHPTYKSNEDTNLGDLLLDFLELYGQKFDYENKGITIKNGGKYLPREQLSCGTPEDRSFCVEHPVDGSFTTCKSTTGGLDVKKAFNDAYILLSRAVSSNENVTDDCGQHSILGRIIHVPDDLVNYRNWVRNNFEDRFKNGSFDNLLP